MNIMNVKLPSGGGISQAEAERIEDLAERTALVAAIAAQHADDVDRRARFPEEAIAAARKFGLLGVLVPDELDGDGASIHDVMEMCFALGRACASTAMIIAMHQVKVACIVRHGRGNPWMGALLQRIHREQLLMGSSTTEGRNGGNVRASAAAAEVVDGRFTLDRDASVISYGAQCDGIVTTARRAGNANACDQVLLVLTSDDYTLTPTQGWEVTGMRGTCSMGFRLEAEGPAEQIMDEPYERIHAQTMVPYAHLCWDRPGPGSRHRRWTAPSCSCARSRVRPAARCRPAHATSASPNPRSAGPARCSRPPRTSSPASRPTRRRSPRWSSSRPFRR